MTRDACENAIFVSVAKSQVLSTAKNYEAIERIDWAICYRGAVGCSRQGIPWFEVEAATAVAVQEHLAMYFNMARDLDFSEPDSLAAQLKQRGFDFVVVDMFYQANRGIPGDPVFDHTSQFIDFVKNGLPLGFKEVGKFRLGLRTIHVLAVR